MADEPIGSVSVQIGVDYSKLIQDYSKVQDISAKSGSQIADSFTKSADLSSSHVTALANSYQAVGVAAQKTADVSKTSMRVMVAGIGLASKAVMDLAVSHAALAGEVTKYGIKSGQIAEHLTTLYRVARLALSPTMMTATSLAAGIALEEVIRLTNARAKLIDQESLYAAMTGSNFGTVASLDQVAGAAGANQGNIRSLYSTLQGNNKNDTANVQSALAQLGVSGGAADPAVLGKIAAGFRSIQDPAKQAQLAVTLFGSQAGIALSELNSSFALNAKAVEDYGIKLDDISKTQIHQFRADIQNLKANLLDFSVSKVEFGNLKTELAVITAAWEDLGKKAVNAIDDMMSRVVPGMSSMRLFLTTVFPTLAVLTNKYGPEQINTPNNPASIGTGESGQIIAGQDINAEMEDARRRHRQETPEGQREASASAAAHASAARQKLESDSNLQEQYRSARQINPAAVAPQGILTANQRFTLVLEEQSAQTLAKVLADSAKTMEAAKEVAGLLRERFVTMHGQLEEVAEKVKQLGLPAGESRRDSQRLFNANKEVESLDRQSRNMIRDPKTGEGIGPGLDANSAAKIRSATLALEAKQADVAWKESIDRTTNSMDRRLVVQLALNDVVGKGISVTRAAAIETELMERYREDYYANDKQADIRRVRSGMTEHAKGETQHEIAERNVELARELELQKSLTAAEKQGADAAAMVTFAYKLRAMNFAGKGENIGGEIALRSATKEASEAREAREILEDQKSKIDVLDMEIEAENNLAAARLKGSDAYRAQQIANKLALLDFDSVDTTVFKELSEKTAQLAEKRHQAGVLEAALSAAGNLSKELASYREELSIVKQLEVTFGKIREYEIDRKQIESQIRDVMEQQAMQAGKLKDGVHVFFSQMEREAKKPGEILKDGLTSAVDGVSGSLAKLMTGQKANFGEMLRNVGEQIAKASVKALLMKGLGALGEKLGLDVLEKPDGSTRDKALWVRLADDNKQQQDSSSDPTGGSLGGLGKLMGGAGKFKDILGTIMGILGGGGGGGGGGVGGASGGIESVSSSISFAGSYASGGMIPAGSFGIAGEAGYPEAIMGPASVVPMSKMNRGSTTSINYHVDARGADLGASGRIDRGLKISHDSAIATSQQTAHERTERTPKR